MKTDELPAPGVGAALAPWVDCFWMIRSSHRRKGCLRMRVLPDGCMDLIFVSGKPLHVVQSDLTTRALPPAFGAGPMKRALVVLLSPATNVFGVRFAPGGAFPFLRIPLHELAEQQVPLAELFGTDGDELAEQVAGEEFPAGKFGLIETALLRRGGRAEHLPGWLSATLDASRHCSALPSITVLARIVGLSPRQLERNFQMRIGLSPKRFCRIVRLKRLVGILKSSREPGWAETAAAADYYDQAHLIHEFRDLGGVTPRQFWHEDSDLDVAFLQYKPRPRS